MPDTRFFTNEDNETLAKRLSVVIGKDTDRFDSLTGYFYITGYKLLSNALKRTNKIRILIGMGTDRDTIESIIQSQNKSQDEQFTLNLNSHQVKDEYSKKVISEFKDLNDKVENYHSTKKFIADVQSGRIEVRAYPGQGLHAKLYISHYDEEANPRDKGRVVTGSSNFSVAGLTNNLELNVELKDSGDYEYATEYFEKLWNESIPVDDTLIKSVEEETWFNKTITPYELFLKFLYEHFVQDINAKDDFHDTYLPSNFMELEYQKQAVSTAKRILKEYNGVFISDVVGLGKTYMGALLAQQIRSEGGILVVAPPHLIDENNTGGWRCVFDSFGVNARFVSIGSLDKIIEKEELSRYATVFVDESHRFRSDDNDQWAKLKTICKNKKVVLLSATPFNNNPKDILSQISLFQPKLNSDIPNKPNLEKFFNEQEDRISKINRKQNPVEYVETAKDVAKRIRQEVLRYVMIRRTRQEIEKYFENDMISQGLSFPKAHPPAPVFYQLNETESDLFDETLSILREFKYARYIPKLYLKDEYKSEDNVEELSQHNLRKILKGFLLKRMDSSIPAFIAMLENMRNSTEHFADALAKGKVYYAGKASNKLYDALDEGDDNALQKLLDEKSIEEHPISHYTDGLSNDVQEDLQDLSYLLEKWNFIFAKRDIKKDTLLDKLKNDKNLNKRVIIFTESVVTANYLSEQLSSIGKTALVGVGSGSKSIREKIIDNFSPNDDGNTRYNNYNVLIVTDAYSEGINLHSTNVILNYDIPWNPTRMMQRAGRVNRVGTKYNDIYTYNFFPSEEVDSEIALESKATAKIEAFFELLGDDAGVLTDGERPEPKGLFSKSDLDTDEDSVENSELQYLEIIRKIRDENPKLFQKVKNMAIKSRSARTAPKGIISNSVLSYIRKGALKKYFITNAQGTQEMDFIDTAKLMQCAPDTPSYTMNDDDIDILYDGLDKNMQILTKQTNIAEIEGSKGSGAANPKLLRNWVKTYAKDTDATDYDKEYLETVQRALDVGEIPKRYVNMMVRQIKKWQKEKHTPPLIDFRALLEKNIPANLLETKIKRINDADKEIIVTLYIKAK